MQKEQVAIQILKNSQQQKKEVIKCLNTNKCSYIKQINIAIMINVKPGY